MTPSTGTAIPLRAGAILAGLIALLALMALAACAPVEVTPPRPTVVVITATGPYFATFDTDDGWLVGESERSSGAVSEGRYVLSIHEPGTLAWTHQQRAFGDGIYELDATLIRGPEASAFGLLLLGSSDLRSFFYCLITGDGRFDIGYCENGCRRQESLIEGFTLSYAILTDNQTNHLRVDLDDGVLTLSINGVPVSQIRNLVYTGGLVGLIGESSSYGGFEATFDNLSVIEEAPPGG